MDGDHTLHIGDGGEFLLVTDRGIVELVAVERWWRRSRLCCS